MKSFLVPPKINFGHESLDSLAKLKGEKAVIVTDQGTMKKLGFLDRTIEVLKKADIKTKIISGVEPNPSVKTVNQGKKEMLEFEPDWIVALGGGSTMDAAKAMWTFYEHPDLNFTDIIEVESIPKLRNKANFAAVPSTSGTASEITAFSVITDTKEHIKYPIVSSEIVPDLAIIDPEIPATMPPEVTANTGMDVLAHAVEAFVSTNASDYTDALALKAIKTVFEYLPKAYNNGDNMKARRKMHNASTIAGMAFSNASLGIVHSLAHKIGGEFGVTHGLANAILLPYVIRFNSSAAAEKFTMIEERLGMKNLATEIENLNQKLNIPLTFKEIEEVNITEDNFKSVLNKMADNAYQDPCTLTNPQEPTREEMKKIYKLSFFGK